MHSQRPSCLKLTTPQGHTDCLYPHLQMWKLRFETTSGVSSHTAGYPQAEIQTDVFSLQRLFHYVVCFNLVNDVLPCEMQRSAELREACHDVLGKSICSVTWGSGEVRTIQKRFICILTPNLGRPESEFLKKLNLGFCSLGNCWRLLIT